MVPVLDSSGDPVVPEQLEPALCAYTGCRTVETKRLKLLGL